MKKARRAVQATAAAGAILAAGLLSTTPAHAGGGNLWQVDGTFYAECQERLKHDMDYARALGYRISNVQNCHWVGAYHWHGSFNDNGN